MTHIFYILLFIPLILEFMSIYQPSEVLERNLEMKRLSRNKIDFELWSSEFKGYTVLGVFYWILAFVGLFTFQWYLFLALIALSFIPKKNRVLVLFDGIVSSGLLLLIILNKYHHLL